MYRDRDRRQVSVVKMPVPFMGDPPGMPKILNRKEKKNCNKLKLDFVASI